VQCVVGKSRSPSIVIAYLMRHHRMSLRDAYGLVCWWSNAVVCLLFL
jgi:protein-tyrosine phosphatase